MDKYESKVACSNERIEDAWRVLSNMHSLDRVADLIPKDKVEEMEIGDDYVRMKVVGLGQKITLRITDKEENNFVKFGAENSPVPVDFWIQMKEKDGKTYIKLTLGAEIPMMFKMMLGSKLQKGLDDGAEMVARMPFGSWA